MHFPDWLFPAFFGGFFAVGGALGWFLRRPVILIVIAALALTFVGFVMLEALYTYDPPNFTREGALVAALIAGFAAPPLVIGAALLRFIKNRKTT